MLNVSCIGLRGAAGALLLLTSLACHPSGLPDNSPNRFESDSVRVLLRREIRTQLARSQPDTAFDDSRFAISTKPSAVLVGVSLFTATYRDPGLTHSFAFAFAAAGAGYVDVVGSVEDWNRLAQNWLPRDTREVLAACAELLEFVGPRRDPRVPPRIFQDSGQLSDPLLVGIEDAAARRLSLPIASRSSVSQSWSFWALEANRSTRYECAVTRASSGSAGWRLTPRDSLLGVGFVNLRR